MLAPRIDVVDLPAHHVLDEHRLRSPPPVAASSVQMVWPSRSTVTVSAIRDDFLQLVGDEHAGDAVLLEAAQELQEVVAVVLVERRGGLVQDEELHVPADRALAISTSCCLPTPRSLTSVAGFTVSRTRPSISAAFFIVSFQSTVMPLRISCPRKMFS